MKSCIKTNLEKQNEEHVPFMYVPRLMRLKIECTGSYVLFPLFQTIIHFGFVLSQLL